MLAYNIYLTGFMGTGKSTVASYLSEKISVDSVEMDERIAWQEGKSITDIFLQNGEAYFREQETSFLRDISREKNQIISCGGGVVLREENVKLMKDSGKIVLLTASPEIIYERVRNDSGRPLLEGIKTPDMLRVLMEKRKKKYEEAADIIISTDDKSVVEIGDELIKELEKMKER